MAGAEIWLEHDRASFGNRMMWWPVLVTPAAAVGAVAAVFSDKSAKTVLPASSAIVIANSLQGEYLGSG